MDNFLKRIVKTANSRNFYFFVIAVLFAVHLFFVFSNDHGNVYTSVASNNYNYGGDWESYLDSYVFRSAGMPLILDAFQFVFGDYLLIPFQVILCLFVFFSAHKFLMYLKEKFTIPYILTTFFFLFIFIVLERGNLLSLRTDGLAFAFFLLVITCFFRGLERFQNKYFYLSILYLIILVLIRTQYVFIFPVLVLFFLIRMASDKKRRKQVALLILYLFIGFGLTDVIDRTYHLAEHGEFERTQFLYFQLVVEALYIADSSDADSIDDPFARAVFVQTVERLQKEKLTLSTIVPPDITPSVYFQYNAYNEICWRNYYQVLKEKMQKTDMQLNKEMQSWQQVEDISRKITFPVILNNAKQFIKHYIYDIVVLGFGGFTKLFFSLIIFFLGIYLYISGEEIIGTNIIIPFMLLAANYMEAALVEPLLSRYTFFTELLFFICAAAVFYYFFETFISQLRRGSKGKNLFGG